VGSCLCGRARATLAIGNILGRTVSIPGRAGGIISFFGDRTVAPTIPPVRTIARDALAAAIHPPYSS